MRTELIHQATAEIPTSSIAARGIAQRMRGGDGRFAGTLAAATSRLDVGAGAPGSTRSDPVSQYLRTSVSPQLTNTPTETAVERTTAQPATNPFAKAAPDYPVIDVGKCSGWKAYFRTHAPGEWWHSARARQAFVETYSESALVTVDYLGTVPENMDPTWVTKVPVDETGKPLPKKIQREELT